VKKMKTWGGDDVSTAMPSAPRSPSVLAGSVVTGIGSSTPPVTRLTCAVSFSSTRMSSGATKAIVVGPTRPLTTVSRVSDGSRSS
jgi:hypothetical protein